MVSHWLRWGKHQGLALNGWVFFVLGIILASFVPIVAPQILAQAADGEGVNAIFDLTVLRFDAWS